MWLLIYQSQKSPNKTYVFSDTTPGHVWVPFSLTENATQYWFDCTSWLYWRKSKMITSQLLTWNKFSYLSMATAHNICEPISFPLGVHDKVTEYNVLVFWIRLLLITIGNERVAMSWIITL